MNHIYQRWLKLSSGLVSEARESWQQHPDPECREVLFQRYMKLYEQMEHYDYILFQSRMERKAEESPLNSTIIPTVQGDYKAVGEKREICKPQTLCPSETQDYQGERPPLEKFDFKQPIKLPQRTINLLAMLRHSSDGVVA